MQTVFIEVTNGPANWGKILVGRLDREELLRQSTVSPDMGPLLRQIGWSGQEIFVIDLQTGEGAVFRPKGSAAVDLSKHAVWVCPMFQPFLEWLYVQDLSDLFSLPHHVDLPDAEFALCGYRRPGPGRPADELTSTVAIITRMADPAPITPEERKRIFDYSPHGFVLHALLARVYSIEAGGAALATRQKIEELRTTMETARAAYEQEREQLLAKIADGQETVARLLKRIDLGL